jgi:error-prone DNA polymerase
MLPRRHNVILRPIDVRVWDCTLEPCSVSIGGFAVRRLRYVKGLGEADWQTIAGARQMAQLASVDDVVLRTTLDSRQAVEAGACEGFGVDRRTVLWNVRRLARTMGESLSPPARASTPAFESLTSFEEVQWDYRTTSHSPPQSA